MTTPETKVVGDDFSSISASAITVGGAAAAYYMSGPGSGRGTQVIISRATGTETVTSAMQNHAPVATFKRRPWYLGLTRGEKAG